MFKRGMRKASRAEWPKILAESQLYETVGQNFGLIFCAIQLEIIQPKYFQSKAIQTVVAIRPNKFSEMKLGPNKFNFRPEPIQHNAVSLGE